MTGYITKKLIYGLLVLFGVIVLVFFLFQGFGDPSRLVMGQSGDSATQANIRKELYLDQPKWKQFLFYLNDVSPLAIHHKGDIEKKKLKGFFLGGEKKNRVKTSLPEKILSKQKRSRKYFNAGLAGYAHACICSDVHSCYPGHSPGSSRSS